LRLRYRRRLEPAAAARQMRLQTGRERDTGTQAPATLIAIKRRRSALVKRTQTARVLRPIHRPQKRLFCNGPGVVKGHLSTRESSVPPGSCFCTGSVRSRHLMGFEEDRSANLSRVVYATKRRFGLT
jgi:hypothetical protein